MSSYKKLLALAKPLTGARNLNMFHQPGSKEVSLLCDMTTSLGPSATGKTILIASSAGNKPLGGSGAQIGFNLMCKSLDKRILTPATLTPLQEATSISPGLEYNVIDNQYLHLRMNFTDVQTRAAASNKSVLIFSSGGNKAIGETGLTLGFNCFHKTDVVFDPDKIAESVAAPFTASLVDDNTYLEIQIPLDCVVAENTTKPFHGKLLLDDGATTVAITVRPPKDSKMKAAPISSPKKGRVVFSAIAGAKTPMEVNVSKDFLTLRAAISTDEPQLSATGKTLLVANSGGFKPILNEWAEVSVLVYQSASEHVTECVRKVLANHDDPANLKFKKEVLPAVLKLLGHAAEPSEELIETIKTAAATALGEMVKQPASSSKRLREEETSEAGGE